MNITLIDIGNIANDGTGDDLRTAFEKVNENFVELETSIDASTVAANVGDGLGLYKQKTVNTLEFKSLGVGSFLSITAVGDKIVVDTAFTDKNINVGSLTASGNIEGNIITASMFSGTLGGNVMGRVYPQAPDYIIGAGNIIGVQPDPGLANYRPARVDGIAVKELDRTINTFDFGTIDNVYTSAFAYLLDQIGLDAGTILSPTNLSIDAGTL
jgi:hypothetical protein